ncbi:hypothetical protein [Pseudomonas sp. MWU12-2323]|uniref:hypothetical protein n=1 Tax=Pseudomonas sp. MWU12-2323 TaxID=2651296 RepID=UPI00128E613B|nr:hypothetical protein [Pseudomonas sp. MWU12-2323]MPQ69234.1 hypothetical protein [Pseudomonas sp. MWU12-2323]
MNPVMSTDQNAPETLEAASAQGAKIVLARDDWERDTRLAHAMGYAAALLQHGLIDGNAYSSLLDEYRAARDAWLLPGNGVVESS